MAGAAALLAASLPATAEPALFVARDADSTVYLFGTVHVLDEDAGWRFSALDAALAEAAELWVEVNVPAEAGTAFAAMLRHGTSPDRPLSDRLTPAEQADLATVAARVGATPAMLEGLRPWYAATVLTMKMAEGLGFDTAGVDMQLMAEAARRDLPVHAFETGEEQLAVFSAMAEADELRFLRETLRQILAEPDALADMMAAWRRGDLDAIEKLTEESFGDSASDPIYRALLVERNRRFAARIAERMTGAGVSFVAVGAAHLAGPDSVQRHLRERGISVERAAGGD